MGNLLYFGMGLRHLVELLAKNTDLHGPVQLVSDISLVVNNVAVRAEHLGDKPVIVAVNPEYLEEKLKGKNPTYYAGRLNRGSFCPLETENYTAAIEEVKALSKTAFLCRVDDWVHQKAAEYGIVVDEDAVRRIRATSLEIFVSDDNPKKLKELDSAFADYFSTFGLKLVDEKGNTVEPKTKPI